MTRSSQALVLLAATLGSTALHPSATFPACETVSREETEEMTPRSTKNIAIRAIFIGLALVPGLCATSWAASEKVLYAFHGEDGLAPVSVIIGPDGALYGTAVVGGTNSCNSNGCGVVFRLTLGADGKWHETVLQNFAGGDGEYPNGSLAVDKAGSLYGTTVYGGDFHSCSGLGCGVVFEMVRESGGKWTEKTLHTFEVADGAAPYAGLIFDSLGNLYGTASGGGNTSACAGGCGVVFKLTPDGRGDWTETVLYTFGQGRDGAAPLAALIFDSSGNLYGTTQYGGAYGGGTVYQLSPGNNGQWTEQVLHSYNCGTNDGCEPTYGFVFDSVGNLYGTTPFGGTKGQQGWGTAFKLAPLGGGKWKETILRTFDRAKLGGGFVSSGLILDTHGNLYGTTGEGGRYSCPGSGGIGCGVVFRLALGANGKWGETVLHSFGRGVDGSGPGGDLVFDSSGHLFGPASSGGYPTSPPCGKYGCGVVFEIVP
jgi:uncharacterized repeat protein (TIGR03803 family)